MSRIGGNRERGDKFREPGVTEGEIRRAQFIAITVAMCEQHVVLKPNKVSGISNERTETVQEIIYSLGRNSKQIGCVQTHECVTFGALENFVSLAYGGGGLETLLYIHGICINPYVLTSWSGACVIDSAKLLSLEMYLY